MGSTSPSWTGRSRRNSAPPRIWINHHTSAVSSLEHLKDVTVVSDSVFHRRPPDRDVCDANRGRTFGGLEHRRLLTELSVRARPQDRARSMPRNLAHRCEACTYFLDEGSPRAVAAGCSRTLMSGNAAGPR